MTSFHSSSSAFILMSCMILLQKNLVKGLRRTGRRIIHDPKPSLLRASLSSFTYRDLPDETLYIIDGTSMLYTSHFSRENMADWRDAYLTPGLSANLIKEWNLLALTEEVSTTTEEWESDEDIEEGIVPILYVNNHDEDVDVDGEVGVKVPVVHCGALTTMMLQFARFVRDVKPRYVAVAFDVNGHTFRNDMYPAYKQHRSVTPTYLLPLLKLAPPLLSSMGCRCYMQQGYEADDVMATLSKWARERGLNVVHVSVDKDMLQLIDTGVHVMNPRSKEIFGPDEVMEKFGVLPHQLCDLQALMGDKADNVPGVKGIGLKTASALLNHFGTVETMYERLGLSSILQSLYQDMEGKDNDSSSPSSSSSLSQQWTTTTATQTIDMDMTETMINDIGDDDVLGLTDDTRAVDALFARINAATTLNKKANKKTTKTKKKGGILSEEEDEGGMLLVEVTEEQRRVDFALAELEISLQGVRASALTTLKKLLSCRLPQILLYRDLVTLRDDLPIVIINDDDGDNNDGQTNVNGKGHSSNEGNDRNDHSEYFRYEGERAGAEAHLQGMSDSFATPLQLLRQQYHRLDRRIPR